MNIKTKITMAATATAMSLLLAGCSGVSNQDIGLVGGAAAGGLLGSAITGQSTAGTIVGAAAGAYAGQAIGKKVK